MDGSDSQQAVPVPVNGNVKTSTVVAVLAAAVLVGGALMTLFTSYSVLAADDRVLGERVTRLEVLFEGTDKKLDRVLDAVERRDR